MSRARTRVDGPAKVAGVARYAADHPGPDLRHLALVTATVPAATISTVDTTAASAAPGVVAVLTHENAPRLAPPVGAPYGGRLPLQDNEVHYDGEPVAVVVADTLDHARAAADLVRVDYEVRAAITDFTAVTDLVVPSPPPRWGPADTNVGTPEPAEVTLARVYTTAARHHSPLEPSATHAEWRDGRLFVRDATQGVFGVRTVLSSVLGLPREDIRVVAEYTGGGFGAKGYVWPHQIIAAMTAVHLGGAVRLVLTRAQSFTSHGYQPPTRQRITVAAHRTGRIAALEHDSVSPTATYGGYVEMAANATRVLYAAPAIRTSHRIAPVNTILPTPMRAPHEGPGAFATESLMDELAHELGVDPLWLRLRNHADVDPTSGLPFAAKDLRACYREGARRFGWERRPLAPRSVRDGHDLVGWGMASAVMATFRFPASARVRLRVDGTVVVEAGCQEIGTGTYTILPQVAADVLGCPADQVTLRLGDTDLPETGMTAGSSTTLSVGSAISAAATTLTAQLAELAGADAVSLTGTTLELDGDPDRVVDLADLFAEHDLVEVTADGSFTPTDTGHSLHSFGAVFAEVAVDEDFGTCRVRRLVAVYNAGRIINPLTARGQMTGGLIWGIGQALLEQSTLDHELGRFVSKDLAGYLVATQADVGELEVAFVGEHDPHSGAIGARGIGELGAVGVAPAIANAVFHATGKRIRSLPITPENLL
ncbi:xanthine dehydrogenase family protein molybdopterin-binding subunit [Actinokineospora inagensis]|uniref:xanthine dehydrogenase family protein molybdopterin-binding subunit n=1 Tax=Actinokineospora inagensis TaxID=103730 RepID=UPI0004795986|nr:xanthine dehydrogenase family protein molybdopterin-binding subunit [Actinokineospora inagensis]